MLARGLRLGADVFVKGPGVLGQLIGIRWNADGPFICVKYRYRERIYAPWLDPKTVRKI